MATFDIGDDDFLLNGEPFRILSGALHYFRVHPDQWADRIRKARQMGLNTIETYIAWNAHSPQEGDFDLVDGLDLGRFLDLVASEGMYAIVRPGPYICAEWHNGGLPAWLFDSTEVGIRRDEARYMAAVTRYFEQLAPVLVPRQIGADGPIILVQIENEYGAYGQDKIYLKKLVDINRRIGLTVPFTTVDQPTDDMLENGSLTELHKTASFGSRAVERLRTLRRHQPKGPLMCSEFWVGWFDHWGAHHHTTTLEQSAQELEDLLRSGASVNIYMFTGGTNFGFTNGANDKGVYQPIVTSYDYDAPLDEAGNPTAKYWAFRDVIAKHSPMGYDRPKAAVTAPAFDVSFTKSISLWDFTTQGPWITHQNVPTFDDVAHYSGFALYRTEIGHHGSAVLEIQEVRDRAQVFLNREGVGTLSRDHHEQTLVLPNRVGTVEILVEDQGRIDYGPRLGEPKGLIGPILLNGVPLRNWEILPLELTNIDPILERFVHSDAGRIAALAGPVFAWAQFDLAEPADLFLSTNGWTKGVVWINGFCLGRYWSKGPQKTLYVPGSILLNGLNEVVILELQATGDAMVSFVESPDLGHTDF